MVIVLFYGFMGLRILYMNLSIKSGEKFLNSPENKARLEQINAEREATQSMVKYEAELLKAAKRIALTDQVSTELLDKIQNAFPAAASLSNLTLENSQLILEGNAPLWTTTAELTHNLEAASLFSRVQVNYVEKNKESDTYHFSLLCDLKEVAAQ